MNIETLENAIASLLHEDWRKSRLNKDGTFQPRWRKIKDAPFIANLHRQNLPNYIRKTENSTFEIDIANASYEQLSPDWQEENKAAAKVIAEIFSSEEKSSLPESEIGEIIHAAWLERNAWGREDPNLCVPFEKLSAIEKAKDYN